MAVLKTTYIKNLGLKERKWGRKKIRELLICNSLLTPDETVLTSFRIAENRIGNLHRYPWLPSARMKYELRI